MKIKWLGHAAFLVTAEDGTRVLSDPYETNDKIKYGPIHEAADIVTVSHDHFDHANVAAVQGSPTVVRESATVKGVAFRAVAASHDDAGGSQRGGNTIFCFTVDGVNVCHLGDLGHPLDGAQAAALGRVDVLLLPVGGFYTIDAAVAGRVSERLKPAVVIPMHYRNAKCALPIAGVEDFLNGKDNVTRRDGSEIELKAGALPPATSIIVLQPAL